MIDRADRVAPEAGHVAERSPLAELALLADDARQPLQLVRHAIVAFDDVVEHLRDAAGRPLPIEGRRTLSSPRFRPFSAPRIITIASCGTLVRSTTCMVTATPLVSATLDLPRGGSYSGGLDPIPAQAAGIVMRNPTLSVAS